MRSLFIKITFAFVLFSLVGAVLTAGIIQQSTQSAFDRFLRDQDKDVILRALIQHYQDTGSWANVEDVFSQFPWWNQRNFDNPGAEELPRGPFDPRRFPFVLVDLQGNAVLGISPNANQKVSQEEIDKAIAVEVDGQPVGWLLSRTPPEWTQDTPQGGFLQTVNQAILYSTIGTLIAALILGTILARSLTSPLRTLAEATEVVAQGDLGYKVEVHSKDEVGQLAQSFNQMSTELARLNQIRDQMTADIAHDLRNPLSIILGYTEALNDGKLHGNPDIYDTMHGQAQHLSRLVDDLRTISLADAGKLPINFQRVAPLKLLERNLAAYASQAEEKHISFQIQSEPNLPEIEVDPDRMAQVLGNLVSNALRYTPEGGLLELSARLDNNQVAILLRDNGRGISPEDLPNIFTRFYRGDSSRPHTGDVGLGLSIVKSLVEAQGGSIGVESEPGKGTTFIIQFPPSPFPLSA
jgi:two-component system sensor histidine kinase BaeS